MTVRKLQYTSTHMTGPGTKVALSQAMTLPPLSSHGSQIERRRQHHCASTHSILPRLDAAVARREPCSLARAFSAPAREAAGPPTKPTAVCRAEATAVIVAAAARLTAAFTGASFLAVALNAAVSLKPVFDLQGCNPSIVSAGLLRTPYSVVASLHRSPKSAFCG